VRQALAPYAEFVAGDLAALARSDANVIVLDDVGALRARDRDALQAWVESGGALIRFAGPKLVEAARGARAGADDPLLPAPLREGRSLGGALTWEDPQPLAPFPDASPFADLEAPDEARVRAQVLARPGLDLADKTWASLADGTPLVTAARRGDGVVVLFHVTADPSWSNLPISGVFVEMLRRTAFAATRRVEDDAAGDRRYEPWRVLDGYGRFVEPPASARAVTAAEAAQGPAPTRPPGLYGAAEAPIAVNAVGPATTLTAWRPEAGVASRDYAGDAPASLAEPLFLLAFLFLLIDGLWTLALAGGLRRAATAAAPLALALPAAPPAAAAAAAAAAALDTRFAYVETGDPSVDEISRAGLEGLNFQLIRRTAVEPAEPAPVDLARDDLSVYPMIYWPITPDAGETSDAALAKLDAFMASGGLVVFDTRDGDRAVAGIETPEGVALKSVLRRLNTPPLQPLPRDHVLTRSFFLLGDLPGRNVEGSVWVSAATGGSNDGVTPLIVGGRDWAGAWARDRLGRPMRPVSPGGGRQRELAYRAGMNMAMMAFTGNYKSDQVHAETLLERLGR